MMACPRCGGQMLSDGAVVRGVRYTLLSCFACGHEADFRPANLAECEVEFWERTLEKVHESSWYRGRVR